MNRLVITGVVVTATVAIILVGAGAGVARSDGSRTLQAWLSGPGAVQASRGVFVGTLRGRTLTWSLAYRRSGSRAASAHLHLSRVGGPVAATLCSPCKATSRGRIVLGASAAKALHGGRAYIDVHVRSGAAPIHGRIVTEAIPTLEILSPKAGATLTLPAQISYRVTGLDLEAREAHLEISAANTDARIVDLVLDDDGTVTLPDVKDAALTGQRSLVFQLATVDRVPLPNPEAKVVVPRLTIHGRRTGP
jgi:hypothetical protein